MLNKYWVIALYVSSGTVARSWPTQPWCQRVTSQSSLWGQMPGTMAGGSSWPLILYRAARVASPTILWIFLFRFGKNCLKFLDDLASVNWYVYMNWFFTLSNLDYIYEIHAWLTCFRCHHNWISYILSNDRKIACLLYVYYLKHFFWSCHVLGLKL